ncbi:MAG: proline racemase family protein [bacterium]|nr:proline racemase family protein [bacterium]MDE0354005.1 proline racemase family protein [bacterium]
MTFARRVRVVDSHTAGEPTRVVVGGFPELAGGTLAEKEADLLANHADLMRLLVGEPRGHAPWHAVLPLAPLHAGADLSVLIVSALGSLTMCGHALIGTVTTLLETDRMPAREPMTAVVVETLSGLVRAEARVDGGKVHSVTFRGVPSWVAVTGLAVEVGGRIFEVDIGFGGIWFALVRVEQTGMPIAVESVPGLVALSHRIRLELNRTLRERSGRPPGMPGRVDQLLYVGPPTSAGAHGQNLATSTGLGFDRSPCGTGCCARMAWHFERGEMAVGDTFVHESVLNTMFTGTIQAETEVAGRRAIVPTITGSAYLTGFNELVLDREDPLGAGLFLPAAGG